MIAKQVASDRGCVISSAPLRWRREGGTATGGESRAGRSAAASHASLRLRAPTALALSRPLGSRVSPSMQGPGAESFVPRQGRFFASKPALCCLQVPQHHRWGVTTCVGVEDHRSSHGAAGIIIPKPAERLFLLAWRLTGLMIGVIPNLAITAVSQTHSALTAHRAVW